MYPQPPGTAIKAHAPTPGNDRNEAPHADTSAAAVNSKRPHRKRRFTEVTATAPPVVKSPASNEHQISPFSWKDFSRLAGLDTGLAARPAGLGIGSAGQRLARLARA